MKTTPTKLVLTLLTVALLASCTGTGTNPEQTGTAGTTAATEVATETKNSQEILLPKEFDITAEENIPFRLTDMTFAEIEAEFGPLTREYLAMGGSPVYVSDKFPGLEIMFLTGSATVDGMPAASGDDMPDNITITDDRALYPGIKPGMTADEVAAIIPEMDPKGGSYSISEYLGGYRTHYGIEGYSISVSWKLSKETYSELEQNMMADKTAEEYFDTHEFNGTVAGFKIF